MVRRDVADDDWNDDPDDDCTMPCPYCGQSIHEESVRCPHCENYLSEEDLPHNSKPLWLIFAVIVCLLAILTWVLSGIFL